MPKLCLCIQCWRIGRGGEGAQEGQVLELKIKNGGGGVFDRKLV